MTVDTSLEERRRRQRQLQAAERTTASAARGGRGEPPDGIEPRLRALESGLAEVGKQLAVISEQLKHVASKQDLAELRTELAAVTAKLDMKANAVDLAELKGRIARIPTVPTLVSIGILLSLLFAAARYVLARLPPGWLG